MPGYAHPKRYYQLVENLIYLIKLIYMKEKNQFHPPCFSKDIAKIWKIILGTLGVPDYTHPQL